MNCRITFLDVERVQEIQRRLIDKFGGETGLRDVGLLESAVAMPAAQFGGQYLHEGIAAMAAAYLFHLCKNHPFVDGNKRVALAASEVFLLLNRSAFSASNEDLFQLTMGVADGSISKNQAVAFFQKHVVRLP